MHRITRDVLLDMEEDDEEDGDVGECLTFRVSAPLRARIDAGSRGGTRGCFWGDTQAGATVSGPHCSRSATSRLQPGPEQQRGGRLGFGVPQQTGFYLHRGLLGVLLGDHGVPARKCRLCSNNFWVFSFASHRGRGFRNWARALKLVGGVLGSLAGLCRAGVCPA